ncbi:cell envelope integrity protein TolA [Bosea thiooxidans]|nr:cell envelope integrity protein TolA [Bosea sp. (in: a-proteobacteria)]
MRRYGSIPLLLFLIVLRSFAGPAAALSRHERGGGTSGEVDAKIVRQLQAAISLCWMPPPAAAEKSGAVRLRIALRPDGSLDGEPSVLDSGHEVLAASALRAVKRCAPYAVLARQPERYERWREVVLTFRALP